MRCLVLIALALLGGCAIIVPDHNDSAQVEQVHVPPESRSGDPGPDHPLPPPPIP